MADGKALSFQQESALEDYIAASVMIRYKCCQRMSRELLLGVQETVMELKLLLCCCTETELAYCSSISESFLRNYFFFLTIFWRYLLSTFSNFFEQNLSRPSTEDIVELSSYSLILSCNGTCFHFSVDTY